MSWHRVYELFTKKDLPLSVDWYADLAQQNNSNEMSFDFLSRYDVFGVILRDIVHHFDDLTALHFFQERNEPDVVDSYKELFEKRLVTFDYQQQNQIVGAIEKIFQYIETQPTIFKKLASDFSNETLDEQLQEAEAITLDYLDSYYENDTFVEMMAILRLIMEFFNKSLERNQYVGLYEYIP